MNNNDRKREVTEAFVYLMMHPHTSMTLDTQQFQTLEHFTIIIYDKTSSLQAVNEARRELFCQKNRTMENIPPTKEALLQHAKRASYQASIWTLSDLV
jgi:hypothetical protein